MRPKFHAIEAKVFGTIEELWTDLDSCAFMPFIADTMAFRFEGQVLDDRGMTVKDSGIREGSVLVVFDGFDPFPQGASAHGTFHNPTVGIPMPEYYSDLDDDGMGASFDATGTFKSRWVRTPTSNMEI